jgi:uncharacterized protein
MKTRPIIVAAIGVVVAVSAAAALAQSTDIATCDRLASYPEDPDKPSGVAGNYQIPRAEIATALKTCKAAAGAADAPRRIWFELGRAYEFSRQPAEALKAYRRAIDAGSTSAMVGLGGMYAHGSGVKANAAEAHKLFEQAATAGNPLGMITLCRCSRRRRQPQGPNICSDPSFSAVASDLSFNPGHRNRCYRRPCRSYP